MRKSINTLHRQSIRIPNFDYAQPGAYFITIVTFDRICLLGRVSDDKVILNPIGTMVDYEWKHLAHRFKHVELGPWIVMPNHVHGIINIIETPANNQETRESFGSPVRGSIPTIIRSFKSTVTKRYQDIAEQQPRPIWQRGYYDHIIRDEIDHKNIYDYILDNPRRWSEDEEFLQT